MRALSSVFTAALALAAAGCGRHPVRPATPPPASTAASTEEGIASWYGRPYHGRRAANGEIYDMEKLTAAHRTLPFGTRVRVRNLENSRAVEVRITDRGPFVGERVIDLSRAAANRIGMIGPGTARVRVEVLSMPAVVRGAYAVQVGAFRERANAERLRSEMARRYGSARLVQRGGEPALWRVLVGRVETVDAAAGLARRLQGAGESRPFVVRLDD